uniref:Uncharacterized protein n=1 Tax=Fagus sylvatica TaxID=28930 RepID=A0A2N9ETZ4_FAGSY
MGQIVKRKKKGRPSKADLARRAMVRHGSDREEEEESRSGAELCGFSDRRDLLGNQSDGGGSGGWFRCWHNDMLRSSVCDCLILFLG